MMRTVACVLLLALALGIQAPLIARQRAGARPQPPQTPRLYIFDCGLINVNRAGTERYKVTPEEVGATRQQRRQAVTTVTRTLTSQLAELGYRPADITYFAFSHAHVDHNANANLFAGSTVLPSSHMNARSADRASQGA